VNPEISESPSRWDRAAIRAGGSVALVFAVPLSVAARIIAGDGEVSDGRTLIAVLLSFAAALGFLLGSSIAAWHQRVNTPLSHGILTAAIAYIAPQTVLVIVKLARGGDVSWGGVLFNLTVAVSMGTVGGFIGSAMRRRGVLPGGQR